jgi:hypothetical protein
MAVGATPNDYRCRSRRPLASENCDVRARMMDYSWPHSSFLSLVLKGQSSFAGENKIESFSGGLWETWSFTNPHDWYVSG